MQAMAILVTAFDTYDQWTENSSWLALTEFLKEYGAATDIITRRYPVDLLRMKDRLEADLERGVEGVIHLGQRPGSTVVHLESIALNVSGVTLDSSREYGPLCEDRPVAYRSNCPLGLWAEQLRREGVPAEVSYHAGTYLCNAISYLSQDWLRTRGLPTPVVFAHLPLTSDQAAKTNGYYNGLELPKMVESVRVLIDMMRRTVTATFMA